MDSNAASTGSIQEGHVNDLTSQSSMQSLWYICMHGRNRIGSPIAKSVMQITHLLGRVKNNINHTLQLSFQSPRISFILLQNCNNYNLIEVFQFEVFCFVFCY